MGNMSYCRFENTLKDFAECVEVLEAMSAGPSGETLKRLSDRELRAAKGLAQEACRFYALLVERAARCVDEAETFDNSIEEIVDDINNEFEEEC
jgi:hypothetical protein